MAIPFRISKNPGGCATEETLSQAERAWFYAAGRKSEAVDGAQFPRWGNW
jgi:hypothetical protein